jgi:hypothetical protein
VTPELQAAYDLKAEYGALVLDPGLEAGRLGLGGIAEGCRLIAVGDQAVINVGQFLRRTLAIANTQTGVRKVHVVYTCEACDRGAGMNRYVTLTDRDIGDLQKILAQLTSEEEKVIATLRSAGAQIQVNQRGASDAERDVSAIIIGTGWKGSDVDLRNAVTLPTLQAIYVVGNARVTNKVLEDIRQSRPRIAVSRIPRSSLGIVFEVSQKEAPLTIADVLPGSPAARADLRRGDVVVELAGKPVLNIEELHKVMSGLNQGQLVVAKTLRGAKTYSVNVAIGKWD